MAVAPGPTDTMATWLEPFASLFTRPTWRNALVLIAGAVLAPGRRTVSAALRAAGRDQAPGFARYHRVLNGGRWSGLAVARSRLVLLVRAFAPAGPVVVGLDDTLERRRWGRRIKARGIYRDPVRSSRGHFVRASGLRWLSTMLLVPIPWAGRVWALPFLTVLAPSERYAREQGRRHKRLSDWGRQVLVQLARWLPDRRIIVVTDSSYAALELLDAVRRRVCMVTRRRLDARLFAPPPQRLPGTIGRPRLVGEPLPTLAQRSADPATPWCRLVIQGWYGGGERVVEIASGAAVVWHHPGLPVVPLRWVLVRDPEGEFRPQAFLCTDLDADPADILRWFVRRWATEVTFAETRRHLGIETQRQWSDKAVARTTPALLGLYSLVALWADELRRTRALAPRTAGWYAKRSITFSDAPAAARRTLWAEMALSTSPPRARPRRSAAPGPRKADQPRLLCRLKAQSRAKGLMTKAKSAAERG